MFGKKTPRPTKWRNSNLGPDEARKQGKCGSCGGNKRFTQTIGGKQTLVVCSNCGGGGQR